MFKQNIDSIIKNFHIKALDIQSAAINDLINSRENENNINLFLRIFVVIISFICFIPFMVIYKNNQIKVLNNFFQIRLDDAEQQREYCKIYIKKTSKENVDEYDVIY